MDSGAAQARVAELLEMMRSGMQTVERTQRQWAQLTASASAEEDRVTVTVNADGVIIDLRFAPEADELTLDELAQAVVSATQDAARQVKQDGERVRTGMRERLWAEQAALPRMPEIVAKMPEVLARLPKPPEVSTARPGTEQRRAAADAARDRVFPHAQPMADPRPDNGVDEPGW
jgi:DNA-binding protein YbaB